MGTIKNYVSNIGVVLRGHWPANMSSTEKDEKNPCWKKLARFFVSFGGLFILLMVYIVGGAFLFIYVESDLEDRDKLVNGQDNNIKLSNHVE